MQNLWPKIEKQAADLAASASSAREVALVGAGFYGQAAYDCLKAQGVEVVCFADNSPAKHGTTHGGLPVVPISDLPKNTVALITAQHAAQPISKQLTNLGVKHLTFDGFYTQRNLARLQKVRNILADERSKQVFDAILMTRITGDAAYCREVMERHQYFALPEFVNTGYGHYVDAGAYVGDSIERYLWEHNGIVRKIYAFEPGPRQFAALGVRMDRLKKEWALDGDIYHGIQAGLGACEEKKSFAAIPGSLQAAGFSGEEGEKIPIITLDGYLQGKPVTCIKADIEGAEMAMLQGASNTIQTHRPNLAISIYHKPDDLFTIAEYIKSLVPDYRMAVRQHSPLMMDTVLYCWMGDTA